MTPARKSRANPSMTARIEVSKASWRFMGLYVGWMRGFLFRVLRLGMGVKLYFALLRMMMLSLSPTPDASAYRMQGLFRPANLLEATTGLPAF